MAQNPDANAETDSFAELQRCKVWEKLKRGDLHTITKENVEELHTVLDKDRTGEISSKDLLLLRSIPDLSLSEQDIEDLVADCDEDGSGKISVDELYHALTQGTVAFSLLKKSLQGTKEIKKNQCERAHLLEYVQEDYDTSSALWSLPSTFLLLISFFVSVTGHLEIRNSFMMQDAIQGSLEGEGKPYLKVYVHDIPSFWEWMASSGVGVLFKNDLHNFPVPGRMESFNQLIGGVQLIRTDSKPVPCLQSDVLSGIYDSRTSDCFIGETSADSKFLLYHDRNEDQQAQISDWFTNRWLTQNTTSLDLSMLFYNAHLRLFTATHLLILFEIQGSGLRDGLCHIRFGMETFQADPYYSKTVLFWDVLFAVLLLRMFIAETKELIPAIQGGADSFVNYWEFWNVVDWFSILGGAAIIAMWAMVSQMIGGDLQDLILKLDTNLLDAMLFENQTYFNASVLDSAVGGRQSFEERIADVQLQMNEITDTYALLRQFLFFYALVLMMKFFKAFRANPRLDVVIRTITEAFVDLVHFAIVFLVIFFVFAIMGHVVFGYRVSEFSSPVRAIIICWRILMGEDIVADMEQVSTFLAWTWVLAFQGLVTLILLNMLLAIVMDTYTGVKAQKENPITIWRQTSQAVHTLRETRGFLDLWKLILRLEDEDMPAHPGPTVTARSLRRAFEKEKMTRANANYLIQKTIAHIKEKEGDSDLTLTDAVKVIGMIRTNVLRIAGQVEQSLDLLKQQARKPMDTRMDMILAGIEPDEVLGPQSSPPGAVKAPLSNNVTSLSQAPQPGTPNAQSNANQQSNTNQQFNTTPQSSPYQQFSQGTAQSGKPLTFNTNRTPTSQHANLRALADVSHSNASPSDPLLTSNMSMTPFNHSQSASNSVDTGVILERMAKMQESINALHHQMAAQRQYMEQRDDWLQKSMAALDRRGERVERSSDLLRSSFQGFSFQEMADLPSRISKSIARLASVEEGETESEGSGIGTITTNSRLHVPASTRRLENKLEHLSQQVSQLVAQAEDATEGRQMLWRIDNQLRQLRDRVGNAENAATREPTRTGGPRR